MMTGRTVMTMCTTALRRAVSKRMIAAESERYRRYAEAKRKIPMNLSPREYEAEVKRIARKFKI